MLTRLVVRGAKNLDVDEKRQLLSIVATDHRGTPHLASSLSDGTLRFLALAVMAEEAPPRDDEAPAPGRALTKRVRRVKDRPDLQPLLPIFDAAE